MQPSPYGSVRKNLATAEARLRPYVPALVQCQRIRDPDTGAERRAKVLGRLDGFVTLADVRAAYSDGLDARDAAWMWRRLLVAAGFAHRAGVIHASVVPEHVLIHPAQHGPVMVDWCYAITGPGGLVAAIPASYVGWYPAEVSSRRPPGPDLDILLATAACVAVAAPRSTSRSAAATPTVDRRAPLSPRAVPTRAYRAQPGAPTLSSRPDAGFAAGHQRRRSVSTFPALWRS